MSSKLHQIVAYILTIPPAKFQQFLFSRTFEKTNQIFQRQIRLAMEKTAPPQPQSLPKSSSGKREKSQKYYHVDHFVKLVKRWCLQNKKASDTALSPKVAGF